jgi:hypothetical protein
VRPGPWDPRPAQVRIVQRPEGEAPEWVRDAWIGLVLPLVIDYPVETKGSGVLSGPKSRLSEWLYFTLGRGRPTSGYVVHADRAVDVLAETQPEAADWWRREAAYFIRQGSQFVFDLPACEPVD